MNVPGSSVLRRSAHRPLVLAVATALALTGLVSAEAASAPAAEAATTTYTHPDGATVTYDTEVTVGQPITLSGTGWLADPDMVEEGDEGSVIGFKLLDPEIGQLSRTFDLTNPRLNTPVANMTVWGVARGAGTGGTAAAGSWSVSLPWPTAANAVQNPAWQPGDTFTVQLLSGTMYSDQTCGNPPCARPDVSRTVPLEITVVPKPVDPKPIPSFIDVPKSHKFYTQISWMAAEGISTGVKTSKGLAFQPKNPTSREAMAAFLYRMYAKPGYTAPAKSPFIDVPTNHKFYTQISWMAAEGISTGVKTSKGLAFQPKNSTSREAMAAFLYRIEAPAGYKAPAKAPFIDVPRGHKFYTQTAWMADAGISTGVKTSKGLAFQPKTATSREAMAAFLYRIEH